MCPSYIPSILSDFGYLLLNANDSSFLLSKIMMVGSNLNLLIDNKLAKHNDDNHLWINILDGFRFSSEGVVYPTEVIFFLFMLVALWFSFLFMNCHDMNIYMIIFSFWAIFQLFFDRCHLVWHVQLSFIHQLSVFLLRYRCIVVGVKFIDFARIFFELELIFISYSERRSVHGLWWFISTHERWFWRFIPSISFRLVVYSVIGWVCCSMFIDFVIFMNLDYLYIFWQLFLPLLLFLRFFPLRQVYRCIQVRL